jgi:general secretion pathway protein D
MKTIAARSSLVLPLMIAACTSPPVRPPSDSHLTQTSVQAADTSGIPPTVRQTLTPPRPKASRGETYSVVVNNVRVHDLLFALARDAKVNVDVHPGIQGNVTLNAVDQTLPQILNRLAKQIDMRWEVDGQNLAVMPDTPFLRNYRIDYVNMSRDTTGSVAVSTQITSSVPGGSGGSGGSAGGSGGNNNSTTTIDNKSKNHFWETLVQKTSSARPTRSCRRGAATRSSSRKAASRGRSLRPSRRATRKARGAGKAPSCRNRLPEPPRSSARPSARRRR